MKLSQLLAKIQADLEANGDTDHVALCLAVPPGQRLDNKPYAHRIDAHGDIEILRDTAEYVNGMTYLVADYVGDRNEVIGTATVV